MWVMRGRPTYLWRISARYKVDRPKYLALTKYIVLVDIFYRL